MDARFLVSNLAEKVRHVLTDLSDEADEVQLAVAYVSDSDLIEAWLNQTITVKLVVALQPPTDAAVLRRLANSYPINLQAKFYSSRFHSKLFLFLKKKVPIFAQVGSSNLTGGGLGSNLETNVVLQDPVQLKQMATHFNELWDQSADLEPKDIDEYDAHCKRTAKDRARLKKLQDEYDHKSVVPRIPKTRRGRVVKEARDYLAFWKSVDEVVRCVTKVSLKEWPKVPLYLTVDHFWHWLVREWDRQGLESIKSNRKLRTKRLPELFAEYARWDKKRRDYVGSGAKEKSDFFRRVLSKRRLPKLTEVLARKVYKELHSGGMRTRRFGSDATFVKSNALHKIKQSLAYLLWADANVQDRISALLGAGRYRLNEFGPSNVQELLGWVNPKMPIRNEKANKALELIGF